MSSFEKLKLSKQLLISVGNAGYVQPTELQSRIFSRINGGQDVIAIAPEGAGKSTTIVLATLNRLKFTEEIAPRVLILCPDIESVDILVDQFHTLNRNRNLRIMALYAGEATLDAQVLELTDGVDIIVATPDRARAAYLKLGLNLNKIQLFIVDDADLILKKGLQLPVVELSRGIIKTQRLVFTAVYHQRVEHMVDQVIEIPNFVEVDDLGDNELNTIDQILYQVPNFKTKINLLLLLLADKEVFDKVIVFVNTRFTAETIYKNLQQNHPSEIAMLNAAGMVDNSFDSLNDFRLSPKFRILIIANEDVEHVDLVQFPTFIHFDIPELPHLYTQRVLLKSEEQNDQLAFTFCTDLELSEVRKLEQLQGKRMQLIDLPEDLYIEKETNKRKPKKEEEAEDPSRGGAFHEKKPENVKTHNYSERDKVRLSGKISNRRIN
jgi:ATP-dependent RNA helicase RhlE